MKKSFTLFLVLALLSVPLATHAFNYPWANDYLANSYIQKWEQEGRLTDFETVYFKNGNESELWWYYLGARNTAQRMSSDYSEASIKSNDRYFNSGKQAGIYLGEKEGLKTGYEKGYKEACQHIFTGLAVLLCLGFIVFLIRKRKKRKYEEGSDPKPPIPERKAEWTTQKGMHSTIPLDFMGYFRSKLPHKFSEFISGKLDALNTFPYAIGYFSFLISVFIIKLTPLQSSAVMIGSFLFGMLFCYLKESLFSRYLLPIVSMLYEIINILKLQWIVLLAVSLWIHTLSIILYSTITMTCLMIFQIYFDAKMTLVLSEKHGVYLQWQDKKVLEYIFSYIHLQLGYKSLEAFIKYYEQTIH